LQPYFTYATIFELDKTYEFIEILDSVKESDKFYMITLLHDH